MTPLPLCILDNVKTSRFSWAELEKHITTPVISGHKYYTGEASRSNHLTWFITLNGASLSTDLAQRVVEIQLAKPKYNESWESEVVTYHPRLSAGKPSGKRRHWPPSSTATSPSEPT